MDSFEKGDYGTVIDQTTPKVLAETPELLELAARVRSTASSDQNIDNSVAGKILAAMKDILLGSENYQKAVPNLRKLLLTCSSHPAGLQLAAFIDREHDYIFVEKYSELERTAAIECVPDHAWYVDLLSEFLSRPDYLARLRTLAPDSVSLALREILSMPLQSGSIALSQLNSPSHQRAMYLGHIALANEDFDTAIGNYAEAARSSDILTRIYAPHYLFRALFCRGKIRECAQFVCEQYLKSPSSHRLFDIETLLELILPRKDIEGSITVSLVAYIAARHLDSRFERDVSDLCQFLAGYLKLRRRLPSPEHRNLRAHAQVVPRYSPPEH